MPSALKTLFGAALSGPSDDRDMISLSTADADPRDPPRVIPRAQLVRIIRPRVEEILEMVRDKLAASPFAADPRGRVILTGGASQLTGLADLATHILGRQVRIGRPLGIGGLTEADDEARPSQPRRACSSIRNLPTSNTANREKRGS